METRKGSREGGEMSEEYILTKEEEFNFRDENYEQLFTAAGGNSFMKNDGHWFIFLNDTWYWGTADSEDIPDDQIKIVGDLFIRYGQAGLYYWVAQRRGHPPEFSPEKEMIVMVGELEALQAKLREQHVDKKENLKP